MNSNRDYLKEHQELIKVLLHPIKKSGSLKLKGMGERPSNNILQKIAVQSYKSDPSNQVLNYHLVGSTPTLKFYQDGNTIIVGIRGTQDQKDVKSDVMLGIGQLENSARYKEDVDTLKRFQSRYPMTQYDYYGVGHSLGGAILDSFLKAGYLKSGSSYNPAVQPHHLQDKDIQNDRIYAENDPLYALGKDILERQPELRPAKREWWVNIAKKIPYVKNLVEPYDYLQGHKLEQFEGGKTSTKLYCGIGEVPKGKKRANMKQAVELKQVRYFGVKKIDPKTLEDRKIKSKSKIPETRNKLLGEMAKLRGLINRHKGRAKKSKDKDIKKESKEIWKDSEKKLKKVLTKLNKLENE